MIKLIILIIFSLILINKVNSRDAQCPLISLLKIGDDCKASAQCTYPNICKEGRCSEIVPVGESCSSDEECGLFFNNIGKCFEGTCDINLKNGDDCGEGHSGRCGEGSICKYYKCQLETGNCTTDLECPFNNYCEEHSNTCTPVVLGNQCNRDTMCPITHICNKNECVAKYSRETASPCNGNAELCDVFNGDECDKVNNICRRNDRYGTDCYVDGDCSSGKCMCNHDGNRQCVGPNTTMVHDSCLQGINSFVKCMKDNRCASISPLTCKACFTIWECYRYNCFASENYNQRKTEYYNSIKCTNNLVNSDANDSNYDPTENGESSSTLGVSSKTNKNKNSSSILTISFTLTISIVLLILSIL